MDEELTKPTRPNRREVEVTGETEIDLLLNQTSAIARHILEDDQEKENPQFIFVQFLRKVKNTEQLIALSEVYTDFELIINLQHSVDILDEHDPLGRPSMENSAKKTYLLFEAVTRVLNNILRIKPEVHYVKESYRLRKSESLSADEYYRLKSPDLDLIKAYTNFEQLRMLLNNTVQNRQVFDFLESFSERIIPQFKEFLKNLRRKEDVVELTPADELIVEESTPRPSRRDENAAQLAETETVMRQTVLSLTRTFLGIEFIDEVAFSVNSELTKTLKEVYRSLNSLAERESTEVIEREDVRQIQKVVELSLLKLNHLNDTQHNFRAVTGKEPPFLLAFLEYLAQVGVVLDRFFEQNPAARLEDTYFRRLELARTMSNHLRIVMREENYQEKAQLPFLNLKSYVYFAVKVIKDLNFFNPLYQRKFRYYLERGIIDKRLQDAFRNIPETNRLARRYIIPALLELHRLLRIVRRVSPNKDDIRGYQLTYYWFKLLHRSFQDLIDFLKSYPEDSELSSRFDSIAFTLEIEAKRVFGRRGHLAQLNEQSSLEEYIKRVEDSLGILSRVLQENYLFLAQTYLPTLRREDFDKDYRERLTSAIRLREHTWCIWQVCSRAEVQLKSYIEQRENDEAMDFDLDFFITSILRPLQVYLVKFLPQVFYSDRIELRRTYNDLHNCAMAISNRKRIVADHHLQQLADRIHVMTTLFGSLAENIKNRSILENVEFSEETAQRILQKYLQAAERI
jgi:hypothetical protein